MQFTVVPASSQVCEIAIRALLTQNRLHTVIGIYRDLGKVPADFRSYPNFKAVSGDLSKPGALTFAKSDAVLVTTPAAFTNPHISQHNRDITDNVRLAIKRAGSVKRLVYVSSIGAQHNEGVGEVKSNHESEKSYSGVAPEVVFLRNSYFMDNWKPAIATLKADPPFFFSPLIPVDFKIPMVSSQDIGEACAEQLLATGRGTMNTTQVINLQGPERYSTTDVRIAFEGIVGRGVEVKLVGEAALPGFFGHALPPHLVPEFVEMHTSMLPGGLLELESKNITEWKLGKESLFTALHRMWQE